MVLVDIVAVDGEGARFVREARKKPGSLDGGYRVILGRIDSDHLGAARFRRIVKDDVERFHAVKVTQVRANLNAALS